MYSFIYVCVLGLVYKRVHWRTAYSNLLSLSTMYVSGIQTDHQTSRQGTFTHRPPHCFLSSSLLALCSLFKTPFPSNPWRHLLQGTNLSFPVQFLSALCSWNWMGIWGFTFHLFSWCPHSVSFYHWHQDLLWNMSELSMKKAATLNGMRAQCSCDLSTGWSASHLWGLPVIWEVYQPSIDSTCYLWCLPVICGVYQLSVESTRHLLMLPAIYVLYQSSVGSICHLWCLPVICGVYQMSIDATSHLCGLPVICRVYQWSVESTSHLWGLSEHFICAAGTDSFLIIIPYAMQYDGYLHSHYRILGSMSNIKKIFIMYIYAERFLCKHCNWRHRDLCMYHGILQSLGSKECLLHIRPKWRHTVLSLQNPLSEMVKCLACKYEVLNSNPNIHIEIPDTIMHMWNLVLEIWRWWDRRISGDIWLTHLVNQWVLGSRKNTDSKT